MEAMGVGALGLRDEARVANGFSPYPPEVQPALFGLFPHAAHLVWGPLQQALQ